MRYLIFTFGLLLATGSGNPYKINQIAWLSGPWNGEASWGQQVNLVVSSQRNGRLMATEIVYKSPHTKEVSSFEHFEIREVGGQIELQVFPKDQASLILQATHIGPRKVVFENPKHDFPNYWSFQLSEDGKLIEVASGGTTRLEIVFEKTK